MKQFLDWCSVNSITISRNNELYFINEGFTFKPDLILSSFLYVKIVLPNEYTNELIHACEIFGNTYGTLMVIPSDTISELIKISKLEFNQAFKIMV